jgi:hypothetical protein
VLLPALMEPGTYAVEPESPEPVYPVPDRNGEEGPDGPEAGGPSEPVPSLGFGTPGAVAARDL